MSIVVNKTRLPVTQWQTKSGSVVSIADARMRNAKSLSVALKPIQSGSGDPSPDNIRPISGRSSVTAVRDGKNLTPYADKGHSTRIWGTSWPDQLALIKTLKPSKYTISAKYKILTNPNNEATVEMGMLLRWRYSGGTWHQIIPYQLTTVSAAVGTIHNYSKTFTLSEDDLSASNLEFYLYCGTETTAVTANCYDFQIEHGSTAIATYEPFQGISVTLSLGQTVYGGTVDLVSGVMTLTKVEYTFNGTETTWKKSTSRPGSFYIYWYSIPNAEGKAGRPFICSHAKFNSNFKTYAFGECFSDTSCSLWIQNDTSMTVDGFKALLADYYNNGNPVQVCYELKTPQTIQLSPNQIEMLMRNNTVWSDTGLVTLEYARIRQ